MGLSVLNGIRTNKKLILLVLLCPLLAWGTINTLDLIVGNKLNIDNVQVDANAITTTNSNGDLTITPNGTGSLVFGKDVIFNTGAAANMQTADVSSGTSKALTISTGHGTGTASTGNATFGSGYPDTQGNAGWAALLGGDGAGTGTGGDAYITAGSATGSGAAGNVYIDPGASSSGTDGGVFIDANDGTIHLQDSDEGTIGHAWVSVDANGGGHWAGVANAGVAAAAAIAVNKLAAVTASRALVSDASGFVAAHSTVSTTELGYVDGATSNLQTQITALSISALTHINHLVNGEFRVVQDRDPTTLAAVTDGGYAFDQWYMLDSAGGSVSQAARVDGNTTTGDSTMTVSYANLKQVNAVAARLMICQPLESERTIPLRGKAVTFSYHGQAEAGGAINLRNCIGEWTGSKDVITKDVVSNWNASGSNPTWIADFACLNTPASEGFTDSQFTGAAHSSTGTVGASANNLILCIWTINDEAQNVDFYLSQAQLVVGSARVSWPLVAKTYSQDLAEAERFYEKSNTIDLYPGNGTRGMHAMPVGKVADAGGNNVSTSVLFRTPKWKETYTLSYYDRVGTVDRMSWIEAAGSYTNGANLAQTETVQSKNGFTKIIVAVQTTTGIFFHWAVNARF